jgi:hypothetical protein
MLAIDVRSRLLHAREFYGYSRKLRVALLRAPHVRQAILKARVFMMHLVVAPRGGKVKKKFDNRANERVRDSRNFARFVLITK